MKRNFQITVGICAALTAVCFLWAQDPQELPPFPEQPFGREVPKETKHIDKASDLLGKEVKNYQDELLGHVRELAIHIETGEIGEVLISNPGYFGTKDTWIGLPPGELHFDAQANVIRVDSTREKFMTEPRFESWEWI